MKNYRLYLIAGYALLACAVMRGEALPSAEPRPSSFWLKTSFAGLVIVNGLDAYSSRGPNELNPLLRGADGAYSNARGVSLKLGVLVPIGVGEYLLVRHHPKLAKPLMWVNFALTGATYGAGLHNLGIR